MDSSFTSGSWAKIVWIAGDETDLDAVGERIETNLDGDAVPLVLAVAPRPHQRRHPALAGDRLRETTVGRLHQEGEGAVEVRLSRSVRPEHDVHGSQARPGRSDGPVALYREEGNGHARCYRTRPGRRLRRTGTRRRPAPPPGRWRSRGYG